MEDYYQKYLKYKLKYLNLKNQKGGGRFSILTFNMLHPFEKVTNISFKTLLKNLNTIDKMREKYMNLTRGGDEKYINNIAEIISLADQKRFAYREGEILKFMDSYLKEGSVICLQEVNEETLKKLQSVLGDKVIYNTEDDLLITKTAKGQFNNSRKEYRVTILPDKITKLESCDFKLEFENDRNKSRKNAVYTKVQDEEENIYHILNVHFHYLYDVPKINQIGEELSKFLVIKEGEKLIIAGDTNKSLKELEIFNKILGLQSNQQDESINTFLVQPDISVTPDHILTNFEGEIEIIKEVNDKKIIYDENMIGEILDILIYHMGYFDAKYGNYKMPVDETIVNEVYEKLLSLNQYFSDHLPLYFIN